MNYTIERTTTENTNFRILEKELDEELYEIYGDMQDNYSSSNTVRDLKTIIIYENQNPIGCGCLKIFDNNLGEIKRVFVAPKFRGNGVAKVIVTEIEKVAFENKIKIIMLQTGSKQEAAINLYKTMEYHITENYGSYVNDDNSVCMKKVLV